MSGRKTFLNIEANRYMGNEDVRNMLCGLKIKNQERNTLQIGDHILATLRKSQTRLNALPNSKNFDNVGVVEREGHVGKRRGTTKAGGTSLQGENNTAERQEGFK